VLVHNATESLATRAACVRLSDLPPAVVERARQSILDAFALGIFGAGEPSTRILGATMQEFGGAPHCTVFGMAQQLPAMNAALVNGAAIHAIDYDDTYGPGLAHLTSAVLPAALAIAEWKGGSGEALLAAYVAGYDTAALIARASGAAAMASRGFHPTGCIGTYGAAIAAGILLGLDGAGLQRALGLAATQAAGLMANVGTMAKPFHAGKAAANGVLAALLAGRGFTSVQDPVGEESGAASYSGAVDLDVVMHPGPMGAAMLDTTLKPYPSCWLTHGAIDAALELQAPHETLDAIISIDVTVSPYAAGICDRPEPMSPLDAKFSLQYLTALALTNGRIEVADFATGIDLPLVALCGLVAVGSDPSLVDNQARLRVCRTRSGCREVEILVASGGPGKPLTHDQLAVKVSSVLAGCGQRPQDARLCDAVARLGTARSVFELMNLCRDEMVR